MSEQAITLTTIYALLQEHTLRFDKLDQRFDGVDQRFDGMDHRLDGIDRRIDKTEKRVDGLEGRLDRIETVQSAMAFRLISVEAIVKEHAIILRSLQSRVDALHGLVESLERRTARIEQEYVMISEALRRLEHRFDRLEADRLQDRIGSLEARVRALETTPPQE